MNDRVTIPCEVFEDLLPLVRDGIASEASEKLVKEHLSECENCRIAFGGEEPQQPAPEVDDVRILGKINSHFFRLGVLALLVLVVVGTSQTLSSGLIYNIILMPAAGALGTFLFKKFWMVLPIGVFFATLLFSTLFELLGNSWESISGHFSALILYAFIYAALTFVGSLIFKLFRFAFGKEEVK